MPKRLGCRSEICDPCDGRERADACSDCENPNALTAIAKTRVTRELTPSEKLTYLR